MTTGMKTLWKCLKWATLSALCFPLIAGCEKRDDTATNSAPKTQVRVAEEPDPGPTRPDTGKRRGWSDAVSETGSSTGAEVTSTARELAETTGAKTLPLQVKQPLDEFRQAIAKARVEANGDSHTSQAMQLRTALLSMTDQLMQQSTINAVGQEIIQGYRDEKFQAPLNDLEKRSDPDAIALAFKEISELVDLLEHYLPEYIIK
jgi:hypothetical protein